MKKFAMILTLLLCFSVLSISGCKKDKEEPIDVTTNEVVGETTSSESLPEDSKETVTGDVYSEGKSTELDSEVDYQDAQGTPVTDQGLLTEFQSFIEKFYYSFLFAPKSESGKISEMDMQLFAISFIYQYEYTDLRFDADQFVLYIPKDNVTEVINRFFDYNFIYHRYPLDSQIAYEDGYYLMPARDDDLKPVPVISQVLKLSDFTYKISYASSVAGAEHFEAVVEEREGRYTLVNFMKVEAPNPAN